VQENVQEPWFRRQTWSWYVELADGSQHRLGKHPDDVPPRKGKKGWNPPPEIVERWHEVMGDAGARPPAKDPTIAQLCDDFLTACHGDVGEETHAWYRSFLQDFCARNPGLRAAAVGEDHVKRWLRAERKRPWGPSTRRSALTILNRVFNWAVRSRPRRLAENPIAHVEKPPVVRRERVLSDEEKAKILSWYPEGDPFRDFLVAMMESGCRPGEVMKVTAADVDLAEGTWTLVGKTTRATGRMRTVYMTQRLGELTRRLMRLHPEGPLFRNADGNPWTRQAVNCRFRRKKARKRDRLAGDVVAYTYRATWATDALANEVPDATVAELMGHRDTQMVHKHYKVLAAKKDYLREAAQRAVR
jgi:integrase